MSASVLYAGSFDPVTNGHIDVIRRAVKVFGGVRVVLMVNSQKNYLFDLEERVALLKESLGGDTENIEIDTFNGLLVDYCEQNGIYTVVRGLRAMTDFDYEFQMALTNRRLNRNSKSLSKRRSRNSKSLNSRCSNNSKSRVPSSRRCSIRNRLLLPPRRMQPLKMS